MVRLPGIFIQRPTPLLARPATWLPSRHPAEAGRSARSRTSMPSARSVRQRRRHVPTRPLVPARRGPPGEPNKGDHHRLRPGARGEEARGP
jgi:hypothetical protein